MMSHYVVPRLIADGLDRTLTLVAAMTCWV